MRRFVLIDHSIVDGGGHYLEYARRVLDAAAAAGWRPVLATNRTFAGAAAAPGEVHAVYERAFDPRLDRGQPGSLLDGRGWLRWATGSLAQARRLAGEAFARDTRELLRRLELGSEDMVFVPTLGAPELEALAPLLAAEPAAAAAWHLLFRRNVFAGREPDYARQRRSAATMRRAFEGLARAAARRVHCYTDTEALAVQYGLLTEGLDVGFDVCPIPVDHGVHALAGHPPPPGPANVLYLGDARREKGFERLPALVEELADLTAKGELCFTAHAYIKAYAEPAVLRARERLARHPPHVVRLVDTELDSEGYLQLLGQAHVVLLPYDAPLYYARSSSILAEAIAAGRPVVVPAGTWMATCLAELDRAYHREVEAGSQRVGRRGAPGLAYATREGIGAALRELLADLAGYRQAATAAAESWSRTHSAQALVSQLLAAHREPASLPATAS